PASGAGEVVVPLALLLFPAPPLEVLGGRCDEGDHLRGEPVARKEVAEHQLTEQVLPVHPAYADLDSLPRNLILRTLAQIRKIAAERLDLCLPCASYSFHCRLRIRQEPAGLKTFERRAPE